jgi:DNA-directed RNA polymerase beta' subunit
MSVHPLPTDIYSSSLVPLTYSQIRALSVVQITSSQLFSPPNNIPNPRGLYDPRLGPVNKSDICATCQNNYFDCEGHFGSIELPLCVYNPWWLKITVRLLRGLCWNCGLFRLTRNEVRNGSELFAFDLNPNESKSLTMLR